MFNSSGQCFGCAGGSEKKPTRYSLFPQKPKAPPAGAARPRARMPTIEDARAGLEATLRTALSSSGMLSDVVERAPSSLKDPAAVAPWQGFPYKLYASATATAALRGLLKCTLPGTTATFEEVLGAISHGSTGHAHHFCYLVGGQVRDVLRGVLSSDVDFNYSCDAKEVALATVSRAWPTKYKCIGPTDAPNYVLIGDESVSTYLEGFCISFNGTTECYKMDFRQNMLFYDLTNDVILDKTGHGVEDIRAGALRFSCDRGERFEQWSGATITPGLKELRYIKFLLRAQAKGTPLQVDAAECAFVVSTLRTTLRTNADALRAFWFGYALEAQLGSAEGLSALRQWVCEHGGQAWWEEQWVPLARACVTGSAVAALAASPSTAASSAPKRLVDRRSGGWWGRWWRKLEQAPKEVRI